MLLDVLSDRSKQQWLTSHRDPYEQSSVKFESTYNTFDSFK